MPKIASRAIQSSLSVVFIVATFAAAEARCDWQADLRVITPANELKGMARVKRARLRFDVASTTTYIIDFPGSRSTVLSHKSKTATAGELARSKLKVALPACTAVATVAALESCLKGEGYRKVRTETVNGYPSAVYEKAAKGSGASGARVVVWRATQFAEPVYARSASFDESGSVLSQADFSNITVEPQDEALFSVPGEYRVTPAGH